MDNKTRIIEHYNNVSQHYNESFNSGLLGKERKKERRALFSLLNPSPGEQVLDAGCGSGFDSIHLQDLGCHVIGVDCSTRMVDELKKKGVEAIVADLESLSLKSTFDKILCAGSLEFVVDLEKVFTNLYHHLKPGGIVVVLIPKKNLVGFVYFLYHFLFHRIRIALRSKGKLKAMINRAGFINPVFTSASIWVYAIKFEKEVV